MAIKGMTDIPIIGTLKPKVVSPTNKVSNPFSSMIDSADATQKQSDNLMAKMVAGEPVEPHDVMISLRKAETQFHLVMQLRNKVLEAYNTVMKEQI